MLKVALSLCFYLFILSHQAFADKSFSQASLSYDYASKLVESVLKEAKKRDLTLAVAITDQAGNLVAFARMDGTKPIVLNVALGKAYTSAVARNTTKDLQEKALPGGPAFGGVTNMPGVMTIQGGVPIFENGQCIGVSGTAATEDQEIAELAIKMND